MEKPQEITKQFIAVRAVIVKDDKVLGIRESSTYEAGTNHGKYDFPGGKVKVGESVHDALTRELMEEVGAEVKIGTPFFVDEWRTIIKGEFVQIIGIFFECELITENIALGEDHDDAKWIGRDEYESIPLIVENRHAIEAYFALKNK